MKFCYVDESGMGSEPFLVMAGVIVDAQRMHMTKDDWVELLRVLSRAAGRPIKEFHTREFYAGNGPWRGITGPTRAQVISSILAWWGKRRHGVTFTGIDKAQHGAMMNNEELLLGCETPWQSAALHIILSMQKNNQRIPKNKGHTLMLFDRESREEVALSKTIANPPSWTDEYYDRGKKQAQLDQIIDVPFFCDSQQVLLIQVADLIAYVLRRYTEIQEGRSGEQYSGEMEKLQQWIRLIKKRVIPSSTRWPKTGLKDCHKTFAKLVPEALMKIS